MPRKNNRHVIISGTGRAGTTFLVQMLTHLGKDTGFTPYQSMQVDRASNAGLEYDLRTAEAPYVVKSPFICDYLEDFLVKNHLVAIDYAIVPIRDLQDAAESRRFNAKLSPGLPPQQVTGGLFGTDKPGEQERVLKQKLDTLLSVIEKHKIPVLKPEYPRLKDDPEYLFQQLSVVFPDIQRHVFDTAYKAVYQPNAGFKNKGCG